MCRACSADPKDQDALYSYAEMCREQGDHRRAAEVFKKLAALVRFLFYFHFTADADTIYLHLCPLSVDTGGPFALDSNRRSVSLQRTRRRSCRRFKDVH